MIRKYLIFIWFIFGLFNFSFAQNLSLKFYGGGNFYYSKGIQIHSHGEEQLNADNGKIGYFLGYGISYRLPEKLIFDVGIEFSQRNEDKEFWLILENPYRYQYLSLSPSFGYEVFKNFQPRIGFQIDHLLHKQKINYTDFINEKSTFSNYDYGIVIGFSYRIDQIEILGSYYHGLPYVVNLKGGQVENHDFSETTKSRMFKFGVGYLIN